jgi:enterochelin esterase-like enzyme
MRRIVSFAMLLLATAAFAQTPKPVPPHSEVNPDGSITFRYTAPSATSVAVTLDLYNNKPLAMTHGEGGVWSVTTPPLPPEYYGYALTVDGVAQLDPRNRDVRFNYRSLGDQLLVPGHPPAPWERTDIPHGRVDHHFYTTHVVKNLPDNQSGYVVYTPPGYDQHRKGGYPVLYLLHGWSDNETGWTQIGLANFILDTLIDGDTAVPMIVVMPLGYGNLNFVTSDDNVWMEPVKVDDNVALFSQALETEVMPAIDREYNVAKGRENRAIAGLSMGGLESLYVGLNHTAQFAWIGGMSAAVHGRHFDEHTPDLDAKKANLRLLWVACGKQDTLLPPNREFIAWARGKGLEVTAVETPLAHVWLTWRDNLLQFVPLLFRPK